MKIPINYRYIYDFTPEDFEKYPNDKLYTGTFWKEINHKHFVLYHNDVEILVTKKKFVTYNRNNTIGDDTFLTIYDMDGNTIDSKQIEIIQAHNMPQNQLPQIKS